jgi:hypothetical protein
VSRSLALFATLSCALACAVAAPAKRPFTGVVTLELVREQSTGPYGAYRFKLEVPGYGSYPGHAAARGRQMAIHFALTDQSTKDYGTGIAEFSHQGGKWSFRKYYYEPEYKDGNFGIERCVKR